MLGVVLIAISMQQMAAQEAQSALPKWVSEKGYWVVRSNINDRYNHSIWFYNNDNILVHRETVTGTRLNPNKRKVRMRLKRILESAVIAAGKRSPFRDDQGLSGSPRE